MKLLPGEKIEDLLCNGLKIIQHKDSFRFAIDSVLLANFVKAGPKDSVIDLGTGSGVILILLSAKTCAKKFYGIELLPEIAERAVRSVKLNNLQDKIQIINDDLKRAPEIFPTHSFSVVVTNPPYMTVDEGKISPNKEKAYARHEIAVTLEDIVKTSEKLLKFGGRFYMVYRTVRLADAIFMLKKYHLEPKLLRMIQPSEDKEPNLFLIMAKKGAGVGLKIQKSLVVYQKNGDYTDEIKQIYFTDSMEEGQKHS